MNIKEKNGNWIVLTEEGKFTFGTKEACDEFVKSQTKQEEPIIFEDDWEDDGQPDEAQEWYDFDPDA